MRWFAYALVLVTIGCGATETPGSTGFPADPLLTVQTQSGRYQVELRSSPQPPVRGEGTFRYRITEAGKGVVGLQLSVQPWMPLMGHGSSETPVVKEIGDGTYEVSNVYLFMSGLWELRTTITREVSDNVSPQFEIH